MYMNFNYEEKNEEKKPIALLINKDIELDWE